MNLKNLFFDYCENQQFEINQNQIEIINKLKDYYQKNFNQNLLDKLFKRKNNKLGFYLTGDVGVGKTMILNFFFWKNKTEEIETPF